MKFADKLKEVLKHNPDIQKHRAIINAMYYVSKHNPKMSLEITTIDGYEYVNISLCCFEKRSGYYEGSWMEYVAKESLTLKPITSYITFQTSI